MRSIAQDRPVVYATQFVNRKACCTSRSANRASLGCQNEARGKNNHIFPKMALDDRSIAGY